MGRFTAWSGLRSGIFAYNRGLPLTIRSAFYPLLGDRVWGWPGHIIDTFAIFAGPVRAGDFARIGSSTGNFPDMNYLFDIPANSTTMVVLIVIITAIALTSVMTGINVGIKRLSQFNISPRVLVVGGCYHSWSDALHLSQTMFDGLVSLRSPK